MEPGSEGNEEPRYEGQGGLCLEQNRIGMKLPRSEGGSIILPDGTLFYRGRNTNKHNERKRCRSRSTKRQSVTGSDNSEDEREKTKKLRGKSQDVRSETRRRRNRSSSSSDGEFSRVSRKKRKKESGNKLTLDKFLSILENVRRSDRPKLTFNTNAIPEFDPMSKEQTVSVWLNKIDECAEIYGWDEKEIIHYALPKLTGVAKTWYQGLPSLLYTWTEWKRKLIESFPSSEDYADLLTEMLAKRVKYGESLEQYYYSKLNYLNRCNIYGKKAVDCILHGVEDRAIKVGAQAAQFREPEQVLKYFRTVKVGQKRDNQDFNRTRYDRRASGNVSQRVQNPKSGNPSIRCFNCNEIGHPSFKCEKPLIKCTTCDRFGHQASNCYKYKGNTGSSQTETQTKEKVEKQVSRLSTVETTNDKYIFDIKINNVKVECHVDLGSQCSLIKISKAKELGLNIKQSSDLPVLKGLGANLIKPLGVISAKVEVQGIEKIIDIYAVDDYVLSHPTLLGHSFTEMPDIIITKTPSNIIFEKINDIKIHLVTSNDVFIAKNSLSVVPVSTHPFFDGVVYVRGSLRSTNSKEYFLLSGNYEIRNGHGSLLIYNASPSDITISKDSLLTRSSDTSHLKSPQVLTCCKMSFDTSSSDDIINCGDKLDTEQRLALESLLNKHQDCFSKSLKELGFTNVTEMVIELEDTKPIVYRPYRLSYAERSLVNDMVKEMLDSGIARESSSPYASPIVLVQKKTGEKRLCVDYRALNRKTKKEHYPLPRIEDQLDLLAGNKLFTSLDLASGYYQIPIAEESRSKTAFVTPDGQFEYNRMPFGLVNAPSVFQRTMNKILHDAKIKYAIVYMDDILIPCKDVTEGLKRLEEVLALLKQGGLTLKLAKCNFFMDTIDFLGFEVSSTGIRPGNRKTNAVSKFPTPKNQHELRQFLGLSGFFRRFIKNYAIITSPLTDLLKKDTTWAWGDKQDKCFVTVKEILTQRPLLALYDPKAETHLHTDACQDGLAGILLQIDSSGTFHPVSYFSRKTSLDERKLHSYELETLAVVASLNRFRVYLLGIPFTIYSDCNALRTTFVKRDLIPRVARWWVQLQEFDCVIEYRPGSRMTHVDALSRGPVEAPTAETHVLDVLPVESSDQDWITTVQDTDDEVQRIKSMLSGEKKYMSMDVRKNYKLKNGRVYRIVGDEIRWLVPKGVRWQILKKNHDDIGHYGFDKTLQRIQQHYWFPKMRRFVKKYVQSCLECAHHKIPGGKREGELHAIEKISVPFHTVHVDHLGPFVKSKRGNSYLLVIVDGFTKYVNITAVKDTKSQSSIRVIKEHMSHFGVPTRLISDKGTSFTSKVFKDFTSSYGIKHIINAVATPRANGQVERFNRTILDALSTSAHNKDDKSWDECIHDIQVGLNTTIHKTTQKSPSELLFGFNVVSRTEGILNPIISDTTTLADSEELRNIRNRASERIKEQQLKDTERFNKHRLTGKCYKVGDLVSVERQLPHDGKSQKLVVKFQGPYRVIKILPNDRYLIEDTQMTRKHGRRYEAVVAVDKMRPWLSFCREFESCEDNDSDYGNE
ncbi:hypothetical protein ABMA27_011827 [Loxostege sticticalis]|uniref:RNA-directed DNA polymerase n=1 Tax=Loxostege sticticalis TaxID=481309 RepID=A0ABR3IHR6_LOXSC